MVVVVEGAFDASLLLAAARFATIFATEDCLAYIMFSVHAYDQLVFYSTPSSY